MTTHLACVALALLVTACAGAPEPKNPMQLGAFDSTTNMPPLAASRRVTEQDCTQPFEPTTGNLRCR